MGEVGRVRGRNAVAEDRIERRRRNFMVLNEKVGGRRVRQLRRILSVMNRGTKLGAMCRFQ